MGKKLEREIDKAVDRLFDLAREGRCSCWPKCAMKDARKVLRRLVKKGRA